MSIFRERLKLLKEICGKTQAEIASELEITPQTLSYYFNGREPNYDMLIKLAKYFNVSTDYLLGVSDHKNNDQIKKRNENYNKLIELLENEYALNSEIFRFINYIYNRFNLTERKFIINNLFQLLAYYNSAILHLSEIKPHIEKICSDLEKTSDRFSFIGDSDSSYLKSVIAQTSIYDDKSAMEAMIEGLSEVLVLDENETNK